MFLETLVCRYVHIIQRLKMLENAQIITELDTGEKKKIIFLVTNTTYIVNILALVANFVSELCQIAYYMQGAMACSG